MKNITCDFQVSAVGHYIPERSNSDIPIYFFAYLITIANNGAISAQLLNRHWEITDADGRIHKVDGEGVIGEQPLIKPGNKFEYNSFCPLSTEFGLMKGYYDMIDENDADFKIEIPQFCLSIPNSAN